MELNFENAWYDETRAVRKGVNKYENQLVTKWWKNRHRKKQEKRKNKSRVLRSCLHERVRKSKRKHEMSETEKRGDDIQSHVKNKGRKLPRKQHLITKRKKGIFESSKGNLKILQDKREEAKKMKTEWLHDVTTRCIAYSDDGCILYPSHIQRYFDNHNTIDFSKHNHLQTYDDIFEPDSDESNSSCESEEEFEETGDDGTVAMDISIKFVLDSHPRQSMHEKRNRVQKTDCFFNQAVVDLKYHNQLVCRCALSSKENALIPSYEYLLHAVKSKKVFYFMAQCAWDKFHYAAFSDSLPLWSNVIRYTTTEFCSCFPLDVPQDIVTMLGEFLGFLHVHCVEVDAHDVIFTQSQVRIILNSLSRPCEGPNELQRQIRFDTLNTPCTFALQNISPVGFATTRIPGGYTWRHPQDLFLYSKVF